MIIPLPQAWIPDMNNYFHNLRKGIIAHMRTALNSGGGCLATPGLQSLSLENQSVQPIGLDFGSGNDRAGDAKARYNLAFSLTQSPPSLLNYI